MSAFLGKIHYWLYGKIQLHEALIREIATLARVREIPVDGILREGQERFGPPVTGPLEEQIDHGNIHGWLQERIASVESRLAHLVTRLLETGKITLEPMVAVAGQNGTTEAEKLADFPTTPQELFDLVNDYMLDGMPCDRVQEVVASDAKKIAWRNTTCLHTDYWAAAGGQVQHYYDMKNRWIREFINGSGTGFQYRQDADGTAMIWRD